jgi:molecular chaperone GrpE
MVDEEKGPASEEEAVPEDVESMKKALGEERARAESYLAQCQRAQADYLNLKRRTEQEKGEMTQFANSMLILNLLPVLDDLDRALNSVSSTLAGLTWVEGVRLIYRKLEAVLQAQGISDIKAIGERFDPNIHEAVLHREGEEGVVLEEVQKGYRLQDRVIRPSMVVVGQGGAPEKKQDDSEQSK